MRSTEELIADLDPTRDYSPYTYDEVVEEIRHGNIAITPGSNYPVLRTIEGQPVKGSGRPARTTDLVVSMRRLRDHENNRDWFDKQMTGVRDDLGKSVRQAVFDKGLETIMEGKHGHEILVRWYLENHTGKAKESSNSALDVLAETLLAALSEERPVVIEGEYRELEGG